MQKGRGHGTAEKGRIKRSWTETGTLLVGADEGQGRGRESNGSRDAAPEETETAWTKERDRVIPGHPRYAHSISFAGVLLSPRLCPW